MLPKFAQDLLEMDLVDAQNKAAEGDPEAGYQDLVAGRARAEAARKDTRAWAEELVQRYEETMKEFAAKYRLEH